MLGSARAASTGIEPASLALSVTSDMMRYPSLT